MSNLIDRNKLIMHLNDWAFAEAPDERHEGEQLIIKTIRYNTIQECIRAVDEQPSVEYTGLWIWDDEGYHCSECFYHAYECTDEVLSGLWNFCPHCGVKMRGEEE